MTRTLPRREEVPEEQTWDLASVFPSDEAWEAALREASAKLGEVAQYQGRLGEFPATLLAALRMRDEWKVRVGRIDLYASMQFKADAGDQAAAARIQEADALTTRLDGALAYFEPELLALDQARVQAWMTELPDLAVFAHYFDALRHRRAHVRSAEVEGVLAAAGEMAGAGWLTYMALSSAELPFGTIRLTDGTEVRVAQGNIDSLVRSQDRAVRRAAWEAYADAHLQLRNTVAQLYAGVFKRNVFYAGTRRYPSALAASLDEIHLPQEVLTSLLETFQRHFPLWHRYWEIRRRALGVERLQWYDVDVPLVRTQRRITYDHARELICAALEPLGQEYGEAVRRGLYEERWVDWAANEGKVGGAESSGSYGTRPFLLLTYDHDLPSTSTLMHELGHSMHTYLTWHYQPPIYEDYADFPSETASNFNQALLRAYLLRTDGNPDWQLEVLADAMAYFYRYLFIMPMLARFEIECHARVERGEGLSAETMSDMLLGFFREGFGPDVELDGPRVGITWAEFPHLFLNFYVYQYALGISAAHALADQVLEQGAPAAERYLSFLKAGNSVYPLDALRMAGIDLSSPEPVERAFAVMEGIVARLDQLVGAGPL